MSANLGHDDGLGHLFGRGKKGQRVQPGRGLRVLVAARVVTLGLGALVALAGAAYANVQHYYYDPLGRLMGEFQVVGLDRSQQLDPADNPTYLHVLNTIPSNGGMVLPQNGTLIADQTLVSSDSHYSLNMQEDGNLVLYQINSGGSNTVRWQTSTSGHQPGYLVLQSCNLYLTQADNVIVWSATNSSSGCMLSVSTAGELQLTSGSTVVWSAP